MLETITMPVKFGLLLAVPHGRLHVFSMPFQKQQNVTLFTPDGNKKYRKQEYCPELVHVRFSNVEAVILPEEAGIPTAPGFPLDWLAWMHPLTNNCSVL
jgi:hypothetical protein